MANLLIKYSSTTCGLCHRMGFHDHRVAAELGLDFEECYPEDSPNDPNVELFNEYVEAISNEGGLDECPECNETVYGWPTYLLVQRTALGTEVKARYQGAAPKARFREIISTLMQASKAQ